MRAYNNSEQASQTGQNGGEDLTFMAVVVTNDRACVLAQLTSEAAEHFGHQDLCVRNVRVVAINFGKHLLATGDFTARKQHVYS